MRKLFITLLTVMSVSLTFAQEDPVIMTINGKDITKSEFLQIYLKNNDNPKYDMQTLDEYVDLFVKFKLKVAAAEDLGYDTIPRLVRELKGYEKQLAHPYLIDSAKNESLIREAYDRTIHEVRASHILIKMENNASPEDTLKAYNKIKALRDRIVKGEDFRMVAMGENGSEDPSVTSNGGDLGYFSAFQMVYPFEEAAYNTKVGELSPIFKTRFGYHILKVTDVRDARGVMNSSHIMVAIGKDASQDDVEAAYSKIEEIYSLLENGENFEDLVAKYSDDPSTNKKGGVLPNFGTGTTTQMVPEFEEAAFSLKNDGDYSKPVRTNYGYHIVKRNHWEPVPSFEQMEKRLKSKVAKDVRSVKTQASFVNKMKDEYNYKRKHKSTVSKLAKELDSTYFMGTFKAEDHTSNKVLFILDKKKYRMDEFAQFLESNYRLAKSHTSIDYAIDMQYRRWEKETILNYEESRLPEKYPAYKALISEYHDGILLYEVMKDKVWDKAMQDTVGLKNYYEQHKGDFMWGKRYDADVYECYDKTTADSVYHLLAVKALSKDSVVSMINNETELKLRHRNGKFEVKSNKFLMDQELHNGVNEVYEFENKFYVIAVNKILQPSEKEFTDAKGAATSAYQNYLEEKWISELQTKYKVTINKDALYAVGK